jgi:hypothetical protein
MKNNMNSLFLSRLKALLCSALGTIILLSCGKNDDNGSADLKAQLTVYHLAPEIATVDFYLNGAKQNVSPIAYANKFGYTNVSAGEQTADVKTPVTNSIIISTPVSFSVNVPYSIFISGLSSNSTLANIVAVDTVGALPGEGMAKIRFVQASPTSQRMDLLGNDSLIFGERDFKSVSSFTEVDAKSYAFKINASGTDRVLTLSDSLVLREGGVYTLYTRGVLGVDTPNVTAFTLIAINNE